jgi:flagellar hook protein FlgE
MIDGLHAAYSGLVAQGRKVSVSANNIANAESKDFKKSRLVFEANSEGGVTSEVEQVDTEEAFTQPVEGNNDTESSNDVDLGEEIFEMSSAQHGFEANAASLQTQEETIGTLLDIMV